MESNFSGSESRELRRVASMGDPGKFSNRIIFPEDLFLFLTFFGIKLLQEKHFGQFYLRTENRVPVVILELEEKEKKSGTGFFN